jgi:hypothetical protein
MSGFKNRSDEFEVPLYAEYPSELNFYTNEVGNSSGKLNNEGMYEESANRLTKNLEFSCLDSTVSNQSDYYTHTRLFSSTQSDVTESEFAEEPPLLEELGIDPKLIFERCRTVLNPFQTDGQFDVKLLYETELAGPAALCILLGICLLLSGGKALFGYVYGLVMISCFAMYILLTLMTTKCVVPVGMTECAITLGSVASILGYCLLPVVVLSILGVFLSLCSPLGCVYAALAVMWSSLSASGLFVRMSGDAQQRLLVAYPCVLLYGTFALIIIF